MQLQFDESPYSFSITYRKSSSKIVANSDLSTFFSLAISEKTSINSLFTKTSPNIYLKDTLTYAVLIFS